MRSRVALAVIGILLIGGAGGTVGALSAPRAPSVGSPVAQSDTPTATTDTSAATATDTATVTDGATDTPTVPGGATATPTNATAVPTPTNTRAVPTATPTMFNHGGWITNVNATAQTFSLQTTSSGTFTVHWTSKGQCSGLTTDCTTLSTYATHTYRASVVGAPSAGNNVEASSINVRLANN